MVGLQTLHFYKLQSGADASGPYTMQACEEQFSQLPISDPPTKGPRPNKESGQGTPNMPTLSSLVFQLKNMNVP